MLVWREKRKNLWSSGNYIRTFSRVGRRGRILPSSPQKEIMDSQQRKCSYTFNLLPSYYMKKLKPEK